MNTEELKQKFAKHLQVKELDSSDGYAVEWTVAAMSNGTGLLSKQDCYYEATHKGMADANGTRMDIIFDAMEIYANQFKLTNLEKSNEKECSHPNRNREYYREGCYKCWVCNKVIVEDEFAATQPDKSNEAIQMVKNIQHHIDTWSDEPERAVRLVQKEIDAYKIFNEAGERK